MGVAPTISEYLVNSGPQGTATPFSVSTASGTVADDFILVIWCDDGSGVSNVTVTATNGLTFVDYQNAGGASLSSIGIWWGRASAGVNTITGNDGGAANSAIHVYRLKDVKELGNYSYRPTNPGTGSTTSTFPFNSVATTDTNELHFSAVSVERGSSTGPTITISSQTTVRANRVVGDGASRTGEIVRATAGSYTTANATTSVAVQQGITLALAVRGVENITLKTGTDSATFADDSGTFPYAVIDRNDDPIVFGELADPRATIDRPDDPFTFTDDSGSYPFVTIDRSDQFTFDDSAPYTIDQLLFAEGTDTFQFNTETWTAYATVDRTDDFSFTDTQWSADATIARSDDSYAFSDDTPIHIAHSGLTDQFTFGESFYIDVYSSDTFAFQDEYAGETYATIEREESPIIFTDQIKRLRNAPPVYDDQIKYEPATAQSRKPFRVLAQNIFTKEWVSNDLPLSDPELTFRVSGSNVFKSTLNTEVRSLMDLTPGLEPGATWLHVEEAGAIRQSTILLPFIDSNGEQRRSIEGEGFSSYLHQLYYTGPEWKKVQIDPADIIRYLWQHAQSKGNLGVIVSNFTTPVKLGTEPEDVEFENGEGENVAFEAGPYDLNWWEVTNLGSENEKLCKETPVEYIERSEWNAARTDVLHYMDYAYPRVGRKREDLIIREGENLKNLIPEYSEQQGNFPSSVVIIGAGEGPTAIRGYASQTTGRIPYEVVLENQDITSKARADAIAVFELNRRTKSRYAIKRVVIDCTHINTPWGSFMQGDDIKVEGTVRYVGKISDYNRITEFTYLPRTRTADCTVSPSSAFSYGAIPEVE